MKKSPSKLIHRVRHHHHRICPTIGPYRTPQKQAQRPDSRPSNRDVHDALLVRSSAKIPPALPRSRYPSSPIRAGFEPWVLSRESHMRCIGALILLANKLIPGGVDSGARLLFSDVLVANLTPHSFELSPDEGHWQGLMGWAAGTCTRRRMFTGKLNGDL